MSENEFRPPVTGAPEPGGLPPEPSSPATSGRRYAPHTRDPARGYVAGVCAGFAARLGIDPLLIRIGFVMALAAGGVAIPLYAVGWLLIPAEGPERPIVNRLLNRRDSWLVAAGMACLTLAAVLVLRNWGLWFSDKIVWPFVIAAAGAALIWRQSQAPPEERASSRGVGGARVPREAVNRAGVGAALVVGGALLFLSLNDALAPARDVVLPVAVILIAVAIILAPWWIRLVRGLASERAARIRSQERAEVAAHLHDSVLQTLALVQKRADDPREVAALARRQERELRAWLNDARPAGVETLAGALEAAAAEVESDHHVPIEVVTVGDGPLDERASALVAATREALVNASKFAGPEPIALYAEVEDGRAEVFVRDRGPGFAVADVPGDRRGVRESIVARMERHGGRATVHSVVGQGTEVELVMEP
jgi:signal transduction histidine kinase